MSTRRIEPRDGAEVYVSQQGDVCIRGINYSESSEEDMVVLHRDDVPKLIEHLKSAYQEAQDFIPKPENQSRPG